MTFSTVAAANCRSGPTWWPYVQVYSVFSASERSLGAAGIIYKEMMRARGIRITWPLVLAGLAVVAFATAITLDLMDLDLEAPDPFAGPWTYPDGTTVPDYDALVLEVYKGHEHCEWESVTFMDMAWPPGTQLHRPIPVGGKRIRQFIRDPNGAVAPQLEAQFDPDVNRPQDAEPLEFARGPWRLFMSKAEGDRFVYVVSDERVERWPSARLVPWARDSGGFIGCA